MAGLWGAVDHVFVQAGSGLMQLGCIREVAVLLRWLLTQVLLYSVNVHPECIMVMMTLYHFLTIPARHSIQRCVCLVVSGARQSQRVILTHTIVCLSLFLAYRLFSACYRFLGLFKLK